MTTTNLDELRDSAAARYVADVLEGAFYSAGDSDQLVADVHRAGDRYKHGFKAGWNAAITALSEQSGEFDVSWIEPNVKSMGFDALMEAAIIQLCHSVAKHVFEQDRASRGWAIADMLWRMRICGGINALTSKRGLRRVKLRS